MQRSLVIALLVSLAVWFLTFDLFFPHSRLIISLVLAIVAGIVAFLILRAVTPPGLAGISLLSLQLIVPIVFAGVFLFAVSWLLAAPSHCKNIENVTISCDPASVDKNEICVKKGGTITWNLPAGKRIKIHELKEQVFFFKWKDADPIPFDQPEYESETSIVATVGDYGGYYKYSVSCLGGPPDKKDPMVEVPPRK
ncbi:hypothetical protein L0222_08615 [bacterium]|nr:hypothetical protein [bacterium]MCI0605683.1 hypothetical protein [bacterium]